jgi:hypothetical protein
LLDKKIDDSRFKTIEQYISIFAGMFLDVKGIHDKMPQFVTLRYECIFIAKLFIIE